MAQFKTAIFIGRDHADNGLAAYRAVAKLHKIKLTEYVDVPNAARFLPKYQIAFVSRYLAILEALAAGVPVLAHFNNAIKKDYLQLAPFAPFIQTFTDPQNVDLTFKHVKEGQKWAKLQTWQKMADTYEQLWSLPSSTK